MNVKLKRISIFIYISSLLWLHELFNRFTQPTKIDEDSLTSPQMVQPRAHLVSLAPEKCESQARWVRSLKGDGREFVTVVILGKNKNACDFRFSLEAFMKEATWNSKDLLLVSTNKFPEHSATLRQAIILDFTAPYSTTALHFATKSGNLPNQDWLNVFVREARRHGVRPVITGGWQGILNRVKNTEIGMHGEFIAQGIPAYTVQVGKDDYEKFPAVIERCLRAASNLEQQLHHSTNLFFFKDVDSFAGIAEYLPPLLGSLVPVWLLTLHFDEKKSASLGIFGLLGTYICVPLALLRPELSFFVNPVIGAFAALGIIFS